MSKLPKKPLTCPRCGGHNLTIQESFVYTREFCIENKVLHGISEPKRKTKIDRVWIDCIDCRQDSGFRDSLGHSEWMANDEEKMIIFEMLEKSAQGVDVSEFLD